MRKKHKKSRQLVCGMDVSALAGILLVLVVIVLLTIPPPPHGVTTALPRVAHAIQARNAGRDNAIIVTVMRAEDVFFRNDKSQTSELPARIDECLKKGAEKRIYIRADARVRYHVIREILDGVYSAGVENVTFLVDERKSQSGIR